jgi:ubiquitin-like protein Pup
MTQAQQQRGKSGDDKLDAKVPTDKLADTSAVDDLLDEIDDVLEENAEEFVNGYVQKGGQ